MTMCSPPPEVTCTGCGRPVSVIYKRPGAIIPAPMPPEGEYTVVCSTCGAQTRVQIVALRGKDGALRAYRLDTFRTV